MEYIFPISENPFKEYKELFNYCNREYYFKGIKAVVKNPISEDLFYIIDNDINVKGLVKI